VTKDIAASVRARLLNLAKAQGADFNTLLVRFALERFLYVFEVLAPEDGLRSSTVHNGILSVKALREAGFSQPDQ